MIFRGDGLGVTHRAAPSSPTCAARPARTASRRGRPTRSRSTRKKGIAGFWTYLTHALAQGEVVDPEPRPTAGAADRPPLQHGRDRPEELRGRPRLLQGDAGDPGLPAPQRRVGRRHRPADRRGAGRAHGRRPSSGRHGQDGRSERPDGGGRHGPPGPRLRQPASSPTPASIPTTSCTTPTSPRSWSARRRRRRSRRPSPAEPIAVARPAGLATAST